MKIVKLTIAGLVTLVLCLSFFYAESKRAFYMTTRCVGVADPWYACFSRQTDFAVDFYGMKYAGNTENYIDNAVLWLGAYEKPALYFLKDVIQSVYSREGVFLDLGANVGQYSLFMSPYVNEVHAFEPYPPVLERLEKNINLNKIRNIVIHPVGIGDKKESLPFFKPPGSNLGTGSFIEGEQPENSPYKKLQIVIGDEELEESKIGRVAIIKMDIEGYERFALHGLAKTLRTSRPVVFFEMSSTRDNPHAIKNRQDLESLFPPDYQFAGFDFTKENMATGHYKLLNIDGYIRFDSADSLYVVAYPAELENRIPRKN
jgi:FkbM family methyltransferase